MHQDWRPWSWFHGSRYLVKPILIYNVDKTKSRVGFAGRTLLRGSPSFRHIYVPITSCLLFIRYMLDSDYLSVTCLITIITKARSGRSRMRWTSIALDIKCIGIPITSCCYLPDFLAFFERTGRSIPAGNDDEERKLRNMYSSRYNTTLLYHVYGNFFYKAII